MHTEVWSEYTEEGDLSEDLDVHGIIILEYILRN
jgi:hypothetical protein